MQTATFSKVHHKITLWGNKILFETKVMVFCEEERGIGRAYSIRKIYHMYQSVYWRHTCRRKGTPKLARSNSHMQNALPFTKIYDNRSVSSNSYVCIKSHTVPSSWRKMSYWSIIKLIIYLNKNKCIIQWNEFRQLDILWNL